MPTLGRVLQHRAEMYEKSRTLVEQKGHDYNRQQQHDGDSLFNLKVAELLGIVPTAERGILVRLSDKFMRLISLMQPGVDAAVAGESIRDTVADIHNYVDYALLLWEERQAKFVVTMPAPPDTPYGPPVSPPVWQVTSVPKIVSPVVAVPWPPHGSCTDDNCASCYGAR